jgi:Uma2 family endonuclease
MSTPRAHGLTVADLTAMPLDPHVTRELIGGELHVSPKGVRRHQRVIALLAKYLTDWALEQDVRFTETDAVVPDVVLVSAATAATLARDVIDRPPDLIVEVSSPGTRSHDLVRKRRLYEQQGTPEYWFVDLDADRIEVYRLDATGRSYPPPTVVERGGVIEPPHLPGLRVLVDEALGLRQPTGEPAPGPTRG